MLAAIFEFLEQSLLLIFKYLTNTQNGFRSGLNLKEYQMYMIKQLKQEVLITKLVICTVGDTHHSNKRLALLVEYSFFRENEILESNGSNELFYSIMLAVAAHRIGTWIESCKWKNFIRVVIIVLLIHFLTCNLTGSLNISVYSMD